MTQTQTLCNGIWLRLMKSGRWEYAERTNPGGGVMIIALTDEDKLLFVEQFRPAIQCMTIEMPAGLVGDVAHHADENAIEAARRELVEETGYHAERIEFLMAGPTSAGMSNEILAFVLARELHRIDSGGGDDTEQIIVHEVPRREVMAWLQQLLREGRSVDPKIFAGLYMLDHAAGFAR